jgi:hypothetical protein
MKNRSLIQSLGCLLALFGTSAFLSAASAGAAPRPAEPDYLYKATFVRAAPGKLLDLISLMKGRMAVLDAAGDERPLWWRHTQGDQWDIMLLSPMGSYIEYYSKDKLSRREKAAAASPLSEKDYRAGLDACSSWREDVFVMGPPLEDLRKASAGMAYFHIEIFIAQPGKQAELYKEREMENAYQVGVGRPSTLVFVRDQGAAWDMFSLGCYRNLMHWADSGDVSKEKRALAARQAGFKDADAIGPYMRTLIDMHRDTMGVAIR